MTPKQQEIFFEIHSGLPREGPGSAEATHRAWSMLSGVPAKPRVLDVGCGPGAQTLDLARASDAEIVAIDNHLPYVDALAQKVKAAGLAERVSARQGDMFALDFPEHSFDVVWAEGSIYIIGFERGLTEWSAVLRPGGHVAVTEMTWLDEPAPKELKAFWSEAYPAMQDVEGNLELLERCGYREVGHFPLPAESFWKDYYTPIEARIAAMKAKYSDDDEALEILAMEEKEIDFHRRYSKYYSYVFYLGQKAS